MKRKSIFTVVLFGVIFFLTLPNNASSSIIGNPTLITTTISDYDFGYNEGYRYAYTLNQNKSAYHSMRSHYELMYQLYGDSGINYTDRLRGLADGWDNGIRQIIDESIELPIIIDEYQP